MICHKDGGDDIEANFPLVNNETERTAQPDSNIENPSTNIRDSGVWQIIHETKRSGTQEAIDLALMTALREELDSGGALQAKVRE